MLDVSRNFHDAVLARPEPEIAQIRAAVAERLAPYKTPRSFERTDDYLRDDAGKVRRSALRAERL